MVVGRPCLSSGAGVFGPRCGRGVSCSSVRGIWPWGRLPTSLRCQVAVVILVRFRPPRAVGGNSVAEYL